MTPDQFRRLALGLPEAEEGAHQGHADFRVGGKIFATLGPDEDWGMLKLPSEDQTDLVRAEPEVFEPSPGAWGRQGCTRVQLEAAVAATVARAMISAWRRTAPERLVRQYDAGGE